MQRKALIAVAIGIVASLSIYYVWCSWQWRDAAQSADADTSTNVDGNGVLGVTSSPAGSNTTPVKGTASFQRSGAVSLDVRMGNRFSPTSGNVEHIALTATGQENLSPVADTNANVVLVIDRSGSMSGQRIQHARSAALHLLSSLEDGDRISVVTYSTTASVEVSSTIINGVTRADVERRISRISVGGGTCVSCGLDSGRAQLASGATVGSTNRLVLLSDGRANAGIVDDKALATITADIQQRTGAVSTVGVGLDYNEALMNQLAQSGNGNHYFVEDPTLLANTLKDEVSSLRTLVARSMTAHFDLAKGVEFEGGYDRHFEVQGNRVSVSLGDLPAGAERTALFKVSIPTSAAGPAAVASVTLEYNHAAGEHASATGDLAVTATADHADISRGIDPVVAARVEQAALANALADANQQIRQGKLEEARETLDRQVTSTRRRNKRLENDKLDQQVRELEEAAEAMPATDAAPEEVQRSLKSNAAKNRALVF